MKGTKPLFFCNFGIFKIYSNLAVRKNRLLQSFCVIVKERTKMEIAEKKERNHFELEDTETLVRLNEYPKTIEEWVARSSFKRACKNFSIENQQLLYKRHGVVVMAKQKQLEIIKDIHEGVGQSSHSKALNSHKGRDSTYSKISKSFLLVLNL